jgi:uncharacterized protein YndB with AHSA1/START domain
VRFSAEIRYDADPATVFAMLTDPDFQERKCAATGALDHDVEIEEYDDGGAAIRTSRTMPTDQVPDFVRTFVGQTLTVVQVDDWQPPAADGSRDGTLVVEIKGSPVSLTGALTLRADGAGTVEVIDGDVKAKVPLVGGRIEKAIEPALKAAIKVEQREGRTWLAAR